MDGELCLKIFFFLIYWDDRMIFSRNRGSDVENKPMNTKGGKWDELGI